MSLYQYDDGTQGNTPWKQGADGNYLSNGQGGLQEGSVVYGAPNSSSYSANDIAGMMGGAPTPSGGAVPPGGASFGGGGGGSGGGGYGGGGSTTGASSAGQNPYLEQMAGNMATQMTDNFNRRVMPAIGSNALAAGGYGSSRQGVLEANAMNDLNQQIGTAQTNLRGGAFNTALNYDLGRRNNDLGQRSAALNYDLGLRGNDLGYAGLDAQINQNNFNNNMAGAQFGQGVWNQNMANNQAGITAGTSIQNTPMNYWSQFGNQYNAIGNGYGSTTGNTSQQGSPVMGALGGAQLGSQVGNWWSGSPNAAGGSNSQGFGTGSGYGNQDYGSYL